ncbi:MAG: hypothetical protein HS132_15215 [Planctomycetia bacterium]|nr:hypothetical protein [Planctomycetia bacterium]
MSSEFLYRHRPLTVRVNHQVAIRADHCEVFNAIERRHLSERKLLAVMDLKNAFTKAAENTREVSVACLANALGAFSRRPTKSFATTPSDNGRLASDSLKGYRIVLKGVAVF